METAAIIAIISGITGAVTAISGVFYNRKEIEKVKKFACMRVPCPDRLPLDALESKSSRLI